MAYQALYRKFRPLSFDEVKGQDHIVTTLNNQIKHDHIGHAYLFCGTRGTGKTTVAKIFARAVNCENPGEAGPCGQCAMCKLLESGNSMNVIEMDAASNNKVDDIRPIIEEVKYTPTNGKYKVYIIDEAHMLTTSAFNALLKTLEEPPGYVVFILATTEPHKIPLTILSRCQRYDFKRISVETIAARLRELLDREGIEAEDRALEYIAKLSDGALRDGLSLLEQCISFYYGEKLTYENTLKILGAVDIDVYKEFAVSLTKNDIGGIITKLDKVVIGGKDLSRFTDEFIWFLRNALMIKNTDNPIDVVDLSVENIADIEDIAKELNTEVIFRYIGVLSKALDDMKYAAQKRVILEIALLRLCRPQMHKDLGALVNRIENLEKELDKVNTAIANGVLVAGGAAGAAVPGGAGINGAGGAIGVGANGTGANGAGGANGEGAGANGALSVKEEELKKAMPEEVKSLVERWEEFMGRVAPYLKGMLVRGKPTMSNSNLKIIFKNKTAYNFISIPENVEEMKKTANELIGKDVGEILLGLESDGDYNAAPDIRNIIGANSKIEIDENISEEDFL